MGCPCRAKLLNSDVRNARARTRIRAMFDRSMSIAVAFRRARAWTKFGRHKYQNMADNTAEQEALKRKARLKALKAKKEAKSDTQVRFRTVV